jgi:hypothetical protein
MFIHLNRCCVPAVPGGRFRIHVGYEGFSIPHPNAGLYSEVYLDEVFVTNSFVTPENILKRI